MSEWIKVEDRLPELDSYVLCASPYEFTGDNLKKHKGFTIITAMYCNGEDSVFWFNDQTGNEENGITHWQPLPEPPKD